MAHNRLSEIREAFESGDMEKTRALIQDALREKPTPQLYRLAAEVAHNKDQRANYLKEAEELESSQASGNTGDINSGTRTGLTCRFCGGWNHSGRVYCDTCGRALNDENMSSFSTAMPGIPEPTPSTFDRRKKIEFLVIGITVLAICLWAVGLVSVGRFIIKGGDMVSSKPDLTMTVFAMPGSTQESADSSVIITSTERPANTATPTNAATINPNPTPTAEPTRDVPALKAGRVTTENYNFYNPAVSPGHQAIAASIEINDNWQIVEIDPVSGLITKQITDSNHVYTNPHYSNDGQYFLLRADISGKNNIYLADADTGEIIQALANYPESIGYPRWMPDNQSFLYKRYSNAEAEIFIGYLDGSLPTQLTTNNRYDGSPASSPDGGSIAMSSFINDNYEIVLLERTSGQYQQLTFDSGRDSEPVFSPDGGWIAFESDRGGDYNIWVIRPDGSDLKQVTTDSRNELIPAFSPEGGWLYFQQQQDNGYFSINRKPWP